MAFLLRKIPFCYGKGMVNKDLLARASKIILAPQTNTRSFVFGKRSVSPLVEQRGRPGQHVISTQSRCSSTDVDKERGTLVYEGSELGFVTFVKKITLKLSGVGACALPCLWYTCAGVSQVLTVPLFSILSVILFIPAIATYIHGKKYVHSVYFNDETKVFTASVFDSIGFEEIQFTFTAADIKLEENIEMQENDDAHLKPRVRVKGRLLPLIVVKDDFTCRQTYKHMIGLDKPKKDE